MTKQKYEHPPTPRFFYRVCENKQVRVWKEGWYSDQFEVFEAKEFADFQSIAKRLVIQLLERFDDED